MVTCEVCGHVADPVLDLGYQPLCDDLQPTGTSSLSSVYELTIHYCSNCGTALQGKNVEKEILFPPQYHYRARFTNDVLQGMRDLVNTLKPDSSSSTPKILDIGCNDGSLLDIAKEKGFETYGIEPTGAYKDALAKGHTIWNKYFDLSSAEEVSKMVGEIDFIVFTNVFAHIDDIQSLIKALRLLITDKTTVVIENHSLQSVVERTQFDTFYHEHPRTYSLQSFAYIANCLELVIENVVYPKRYGGNIRVYYSRGPELVNLNSLLDEEKPIINQIYGMQKLVERWLNTKSTLFSELNRSHGPLIAKAYPGRSSIPINLLKLTPSTVSSVYEKPGSLKIGHYVPGTHIPIVSDTPELLAACQRNPHTPIINNAWHISTEIRRYLSSQSIVNPVIDIIQPSDFE